MPYLTVAYRGMPQRATAMPWHALACHLACDGMLQLAMACHVFCQDNPLYNELTVNEHLRFFSALRGAVSSVAEAEVDEVLQALGLTEKRIARCNKLSGGQKRRLWVATALIGNRVIRESRFC